MKLTTQRLLELFYCVVLMLACGASPRLGLAQDDAAPSEDAAATQVLPGEGSLIDFLRDVKPILDAKCLVCHGPDDAKNDFRVDDQETMLAYLEPGDLESSSLWVDYLITDDPDMRMPPPSSDKVEALTGVELATLRLWIEEGAAWAVEIKVEADGEELATNPAAEEPTSLTTAQKIWRFQGLFHPASVHFPIALLTVSAGFVLLSFFWRESCEPVAYHCLWIGALGAIAASVLGWSYAEYEGYKSGLSFDFENSSIDRHRWLGVAVAVVSVLMIPIAVAVRRKGDTGMRMLWLIAAVILVGGVSIAGYQGGELTYGEDHYWEEFDRLFGEDVDAAADAAPAEDAAADSFEVSEADTSEP